ncbi:MAG: DegV family protein [Eubacteriaceae bacterium]|nr:DegV family protein [Eubacteriaceae bacterium]
MKDYIIITDATADLTKDIVTKNNIIVIPMEYEIDGKRYEYYPSCKNLTVNQFYEKVKEGHMAITSQINVSTFEKYFETALTGGLDIIYVAFSSALSGSIQSAHIARNNLIEKYPQSKIEIIDSLSASAGEGLLIYTAALRKAEGMTYEELIKWINDNIPHLCHWFTVDDLHHLHRGGRVSAASAIIGSTIGIKPVLQVNNEGKLIPVAKVKGRKKSLSELVDRMEQTYIKPYTEAVFIGHSNSLEDAELVKNMVEERFGIKDIQIMDIGAIVGSHTGCGTIALFYFGTSRD